MVHTLLEAKRKKNDIVCRLVCLQAIDMELRKLEVTQANQHISYLTSFMPDSFSRHGGRASTIITLTRDLTRLPSKEHHIWQQTRKLLAAHTILMETHSNCNLPLFYVYLYEILVYSVLEHISTIDNVILFHTSMLLCEKEYLIYVRGCVLVDC